MPQKSAEGKVGHAVGEDIEALQGRKAEQQIGHAGNGDRRPERYPARGIEGRVSKWRDSGANSGRKTGPNQRCWPFRRKVRVMLRWPPRVNHDRLMAAVAERVADKRMLKLIRAFLEAGVMEDGLVSAVDEGTPQGGPLTPLTQKVISSLNEQLRDGKPGTLCLIFVLKGNIFMAHDAFDQSGKSSAAERRSWFAPASSCAARSSAALVTRVRFIRASSISLPGRSLPARTTRRSSRGYGADHVEASAAYRGTSPEVREKQRTDHWSNRERRVAGVSSHAKKAWLSRVKKAAHFKSTLPIRLIACSSRSSHRPTIFWCPVVSAPSACA